MPSNSINKLPLGLLGFLGIKNGGQYPTDLSPLLAPVWNLEDLYTSANSELTTASVSITAVGSFAGITVPNGEAWRVLQLSARSNTMGAGQILQMGLQITDAALTATVEISDPSSRATAGLRAAVSLRQPIIVGPGTSLGPDVMEFAAGPYNVTMAARFCRLQL